MIGIGFNWVIIRSERSGIDPDTETHMSTLRFDAHTIETSTQENPGSVLETDSGRTTPVSM